MIRIGGRGYIEFPSRVCESCRGWENPLLAGLSHHRWLVEVFGNHIVFLMKYHLLSSHWKLCLPASFLRRMKEAEKVAWLFWNDSFTFEEKIIHGVENLEAEWPFGGDMRRCPKYWAVLIAHGGKRPCCGRDSQVESGVLCCDGFRGL